MGWKPSKLFPLCLIVIIPENESKNGRMLKLFVKVELDKPLLKGTKIKLENEFVSVDFRYEQLLVLCFTVE